MASTVIIRYVLLLIDQENEEVKKIFSDIPEEDRKKIHKLSVTIAQLGEDKTRLNVQVVGLTQQNA